MPSLKLLGAPPCSADRADDGVGQRMEAPAKVLNSGTKVRTHEKLDPVVGMMVADKHIMARRTGADGEIIGYVPGHGGDVYWVQHDGGEAAVYCFSEFELA